MERRVVVTGIGCVTPIGTSPDDFASGLYAGRIGVGRLTVFDASQYPVQIAAEVHDWDLSSVGEDPTVWRKCPRQTRFAIGAGLQAALQAGLSDAQIDPVRFGVYLGCGEPFEDFTAFTQAVHDAQKSEKTFLDHALRGEYVDDVVKEIELD